MGWLGIVTLALRVVLELLTVARTTKGKNEGEAEAIGRVFNAAGKIVAAAEVARINAERDARARGLRPLPDEFCRDAPGVGSGSGDMPGMETDKVERQ